MITLYSKDFSTKYGVISSLCEAFVEEERNGLFELSFIMLNTDSLFKYIKEENIVVANANDTLLNQKFRIYMTRKLMNNRVEVFARHISFDLMYDYIDNLSFENQSCEYALNQLFRNSNFSTHYRGYSDIVNAQNYNMSMANVLEAIGGKKGSIVDTFGTGAEILRDNENIHVLNKRGYDNEVTIEYKKNLTGFELEEDTTDLVTRISPYAKYNDSETNEEIIVKADYVDSPLIANYSHPYIKAIDYSDKFGDGEIPTVSKLQDLARKEYKNNKVDMPKQNFKIEFIPLSKCVGYEGLEDKISLCDTVTIIDTRYNINTQAKVIKVTFNVLKNRYESMELGEPRTSLGDIIDSETGNNVTEDEVKDIINSTPSVNFPNTLPPKSILKGKSVGLASIELNWTFENKNYYFYELYASKTRDFTPNSFYLIHEGQTSSYLFQAKPNETWYFKVCAKNSHGNRNAFSDEISVSTAKIDANEWIEEATIGNALIGELSADKITSGTISGYYIDARNLSVTDGNGKRTLDIDSFGNVNLDVTSLKISSKGVATQDYANNIKNEAIENSNNYTDNVKSEVYASIEVTANGINNRVSSLDNKYTEIKQTVDSIDLTGKVSFTDLKTAGKTIINGANISTGTIAVDKLSSNNSNPIIKLFDNCAIDATKLNEQGKGTAIRLKMDEENYIKISQSDYNQNGDYVGAHVAIFSSLYPNHEVMMFQGNANWGKIWTTQGIISTHGDNVYYGRNGNTTDKRLLNSSNLSNSVSSTASTVATSNAVKQAYDKAVQAYNIGNHSHPYASASHNHYGEYIYLDQLGVRALGNGGSILMHSSLDGNNKNLGYSGSKFNQVSAKAVWGDTGSWSDKRTKENIRYLDNENVVDTKYSNDNITKLELFEFIKTLKMCEYNYKEEFKSYQNDKIGFIANDVIGDKIGDKIVTEHEGYLTYNLNNMLFTTIGALQEEIKIREEENKQLRERLDNIEKILSDRK